MSSEKKASEGIALLSMYGDEDDEMEGVDGGENRHEEDIPPPAPGTGTVKDSDAVSNYGNEQRQRDERGLNDNFTPSKTIAYSTSSASATPVQGLFSPPQQQQQLLFSSDFSYVHSKKSRMLIVDYGHEEGAVSPEAEDGEILAAGRVMCGELLHTSDGEARESKSPMPRLSTPITEATPSQLLEPVDQLAPDSMNFALIEPESGGTEDAVMVSVGEQKAVDPLDKFLPPPPKAKCSEELQERIKKFIDLKTTGRSFNSDLRNRKEYRNPDFLLHAVTYQKIDQLGTCFAKDVFDPHGYDKSDFYDEIEADMRREMERRVQERQKNQKVDFTSTGVQPGIVIPTPKTSLPTPGLSAVAGGLNVMPVASDVTARDGRHNKKSKWDKVDVDQRSSLTGGGQENLSAAGAHAALLSAAKAGSGYSAFACNKGERRQKISDLVIRGRREDHKGRPFGECNLGTRGNKGERRQKISDVVISGRTLVVNATLASIYVIA
ncbi:hypothetical protein OROHE_001641 [Orobanche hederae]